MEKETLKEICKDLNWKERILVRLYKKSFIKIYKKGVRTGFNW
jgi:hypothetical protein